MKKNFWEKIRKNKGFTCLAPMADVTDIAFRQIIAKYSRHGKLGGGPDVFWTEFVAADGIASLKGRKPLLKDLEFSKKEKPIVAQIFGSKQENIETTCKIISELGFDGIDLNMGCPDRKVEKQGAGSAMMKNPKVAREVIMAAKRGAPDLPISVKTRIGYNKIDYQNWLTEVLAEKPVALTIHLRTRKEMSKVDAHWELAKEISEFVRSIDKEVVLIANGDIKSPKDGREKIKNTEFEGIMIGRGIFGNPWLFDSKRVKEITTKEKLKALNEHINIFNRLLKDHKNFSVMKKHFKAYVNGFDGAKEMRNKLMLCDTAKEARGEIKKILKSI
jgi:nifR3 family TIM-barrel protein